MAGLVPAIHVLLSNKEGVDARDKAGHDVDRLAQSRLRRVRNDRKSGHLIRLLTRSITGFGVT